MTFKQIEVVIRIKNDISFMLLGYPKEVYCSEGEELIIKAHNKVAISKFNDDAIIVMSNLGNAIYECPSAKEVINFLIKLTPVSLRRYTKFNFEY